jgi:acetoacetate decarboxylase
MGVGPDDTRAPGRDTAEQGELELHDSPIEELTHLAPREMIGGFYRSVGVSWKGGTVLDPGP